MKLAASNLALPPFDHAHLLSRVRSLGIEGLEVAPDHTWQRRRGGAGFPARAVWDYRHGAEAAGLRIIGLHALLGGRPELGLFEDAEARARTLDHLVHLSAVCRDLGGRTLVLDQRWRQGLAIKEAWLESRAFLEELLPRIEAHGTVLCFAPLAPSAGDFCMSARECRLLVDALEHPAFGLHLGATGLTAQGEIGHATFAAARGRLELFHIDEPGLAPIGSTGFVDHADMRRHLAASTYRGWISVVQSLSRGTAPIEALAAAIHHVDATYLLSPSRRGVPSMTEDERLRLIAETITELRPGIQADGGDMELVAVCGHRVEVRLTGRCLSCALAGQTLGGVRRKLMAVLDSPVMVVPHQA